MRRFFRCFLLALRIEVILFDACLVAAGCGLGMSKQRWLTYVCGLTFIDHFAEQSAALAVAQFVLLTR